MRLLSVLSFQAELELAIASKLQPQVRFVHLSKGFFIRRVLATDALDTCALCPYRTNTSRSLSSGQSQLGHSRYIARAFHTDPRSPVLRPYLRHGRQMDVRRLPLGLLAHPWDRCTYVLSLDIAPLCSMKSGRKLYLPCVSDALAKGPGEGVARELHLRLFLRMTVVASFERHGSNEACDRPFWYAC